MSDTQSQLDEIYQRLMKDGGEVDETVSTYPLRLYDRDTIRNILNDPKWEWPRLRNLPEDEREPFKTHLMMSGCTIPLLDMVMAEDQDGYYPHDYDDWKAGRKPVNF